MIENDPASHSELEYMAELPVYQSPTLMGLEKRLQPNPSTVCGICPASVWVKQQDGIECYCRVMHLKTYSSEEPKALEKCDGQVAATLEWLANQVPG